MTLKGAVWCEMVHAMWAESVRRSHSYNLCHACGLAAATNETCPAPGFSLLPLLVQPSPGLLESPFFFFTFFKEGFHTVLTDGKAFQWTGLKRLELHSKLGQHLIEPCRVSADKLCCQQHMPNVCKEAFVLAWGKLALWHRHVSL